MNTTVPTLAQISGDNWRTDSGALRDGLDQVSSNISSAFHTEHNADNTHSTIHASGSISERKRTTPIGEWINVQSSSVVLGIPGAGNSWVNVPKPPGTTFFNLSYTLIGKSMWLNVAFPITTLTVAASTGIVTVNLPPGFRVAGVSAGGVFVGRSHFGSCVILNAGTQVSGVLFASAGATSLQVNRVDGAAYVTDANFTVEGQIFLEVESA